MLGSNWIDYERRLVSYSEHLLKGRMFSHFQSAAHGKIYKGERWHIWIVTRIHYIFVRYILPNSYLEVEYFDNCEVKLKSLHERKLSKPKFWRIM